VLLVSDAVEVAEAVLLVDDAAEVVKVVLTVAVVVVLVVSAR